MITPKFATYFEKQAVAAEQLVAQAGVARKAEVFSTGVSAIDDDSATALVAGSFTDSFPQGQTGKTVAAEPVAVPGRGGPGQDQGQLAGRRLHPAHRRGGATA